MLGVRRNVAVILAIVTGIVVAGIVASQISLPYYALTPGTAINTANLITVPRSLGHRHAGAIYLTDVELTPLRAIDYPIFAIQSSASIVATQQITGFIPASEYNTQGALDMSNATEAATYVALRELGYHVKAVWNGAQLYQIGPLADTYSVLQVGDVITSINGTPIRQISDVSAILLKLSPGSKINVSWLPPGSGRGAHQRTSVITLGEFRIQGRGANANLRCYPAGLGKGNPPFRQAGYPYPYPCLGVVLQGSYQLAGLPFPVDINPEGIVGPSAGLAFTLGLIEKLDPADLTGGRQVAATGTMSLDGAVGDVGGVAQKTVAVEAAGATLFFVPPQEYAVAKSHSNGHLTIVAVSSVSQALTYLLTHGGKMPRAPAGVGAAP